MRMNKNLIAVAAGLAACIILVWLTASIQGDPKTYELRPNISLPEYRTDAARAIDAYERMMERYMNMTERDSISISADLKDIIKKLYSIDGKLTELSARTARIEKALGIEQPKKPLGKNPGTKTYKDDNKPVLKSKE